MFRSDFLSLKGLQTPLETAGEEITSFKVVAHLKDGCVERKTLKGRGRRGLCLYVQECLEQTISNAMLLTNTQHYCYLLLLFF